MSKNQNNTIIAYQIRPTNVAKQIMKRIVASKSESKYKNENTTFILWLYVNQDLREEFLQDWFVTQLIEKEAIEANKKGRKNMRSIYKLALDEMNKTDINSPIILQKITFNLFSHYLKTRRNKGRGFVSKASYSVVRSAFVNMYLMSGETIPKELNIELSQFMSEMKRTISPQKADIGESLYEGKKSISYEVYKKICELLFEGEGDDYAFTHVFLTLEWNLLA